MATATGKITQIIGAVIDVEFPREGIPKVYEALKLADFDLTLEVQQQLGDGVVRTIAMGVSEGLKRGLSVKATGGPIAVPVGKATLGRIMDVLGAPQDEKGPVEAKEHWPIHRPAPSFEEQATSVTMAIDLVPQTGEERGVSSRAARGVQGPARRQRGEDAPDVGLLGRDQRVGLGVVPAGPPRVPLLRGGVAHDAGIDEGHRVEGDGRRRRIHLHALRRARARAVAGLVGGRGIQAAVGALRQRRGQ